MSNSQEQLHEVSSYSVWLSWDFLRLNYQSQGGLPKQAKLTLILTFSDGFCGNSEE